MTLISKLQAARGLTSNLDDKIDPTGKQREVERIETLFALGKIDEPARDRLLHDLTTPDWQLAAEEMLP